MMRICTTDHLPRGEPGVRSGRRDAVGSEISLAIFLLKLSVLARDPIIPIKSFVFVLFM